MKGLALQLAILAALASAALLVVGFDVDGRSASADDYIQVECPTPTPGTPTVTNTPGGPTKTSSPTHTPCLTLVKVTPTPPAPVGGLAAGPGLSPLTLEGADAERGGVASRFAMAGLAIAFALAGCAWYAKKRWIRR